MPKIGNSILVFIYVIFLLDNVLTQDCLTYGKPCSDTGQCCGGCCWNKTCIDTPGPCYNQQNPCWEKYCPPMLNCYLYKPDDCPGCEPTAVCGE